MIVTAGEIREAKIAHCSYDTKICLTVYSAKLARAANEIEASNAYLRVTKAIHSIYHRNSRNRTLVTMKHWLYVCSQQPTKIKINLWWHGYHWWSFLMKMLPGYHALVSIQRVTNLYQAWSTCLFSISDSKNTKARQTIKVTAMELIFLEEGQQMQPL